MYIECLVNTSIAYLYILQLAEGEVASLVDVVGVSLVEFADKLLDAGYLVLMERDISAQVFQWLAVNAVLGQLLDEVHCQLLALAGKGADCITARDGMESQQR